MFCSSVWAGTLAVTRTVVPDYEYHFTGTNYVENQSYGKSVGFHVEVGGTWRDLPASWKSSLLTMGGNRVESWNVDMRIRSTIPDSNIRFAVYYHNLDRHTSQWDNNGGSDYYVNVIIV
jgi:hypothetical protein